MSVKAKKFVSEKGYYEILEVSAVATTNEIQRSFERLCDEYVNIKDEDPQLRKTSAETLYTLTKAYEILTDPFQRMNYDDRRFGDKQNNNNEVETIFKEGLKASKLGNSETAIRFFKESVELFPHRPIYRVNLAIACFEAGDKDRAVKELRMALMLDPTNEFAHEVVAKLLFGVSDRKGFSGFFAVKSNQQLVALIASTVILTGGLYFGVPKIKMLYDKFMNSGSRISAKEKAEIMKSKLPEDLRQAIDSQSMQRLSNSSSPSGFIANINKLDDNYKPDGKFSDYSRQKAIKKTYYKDKDMVIVDYENGSILTYKPQDVIGWKMDLEKKVPVIISKGNEIIPVQTDIPVTLSDGKTVKPGEQGFPSRVFPEYESVSLSPETPVTAESIVPSLEVNQETNNSDKPLPDSLPPPVSGNGDTNTSPPINEKNNDLAPPPPPPNIDSSEKKGDN